MTVYLCVSTIGENEAPAFARRIVEEKLVACVNIIPGVRSIYRWEGEIKDDAECVLLAKTAPRTMHGFEERFVELHPYDCPELLLVPVEDGHAGYLKWVESLTGGRPGA